MVIFQQKHEILALRSILSLEISDNSVFCFQNFFIILSCSDFEMCCDFFVKKFIFICVMTIDHCITPSCGYSIHVYVGDLANLRMSCLNPILGERYFDIIPWVNDSLGIRILRIFHMLRKVFFK